MPLTPSRAPARGRFALALDGAVCGFVAAAEGGDISAPVIREPVGAFVSKRLGAPAPEPLVLSFDLSLQKPVYDWIGEFWEGTASAKSGSVISLDINNRARSELVFENASIETTTLPAMDAGSKTPCLLTMRLAPTTTSRRSVSGPLAGLSPAPGKKWLPSNFRLEIDGLDTTRVSKIEALTVTAGENGAIDVSDLRAVVAETQASTWTQWHQDFVLKGKNDASSEKSGSLVFFAPDLQSELGQITLSGLGIHRLTHEAVSAGRAGQITQLAAELYCKRIDLNVR